MKLLAGIGQGFWQYPWPWHWFWCGDSCGNEPPEKGMGEVRPGAKFWMELGRNEERMIWVLNNFH